MAERRPWRWGVGSLDETGSGRVGKRSRWEAGEWILARDDEWAQTAGDSFHPHEQDEPLRGSHSAHGDKTARRRSTVPGRTGPVGCWIPKCLIRCVSTLDAEA